MDPSQYKTVKTQRGYTYHYHVANEDAKTAILFLHGFPSTSLDWSLQVKYFTERGFKVIAPDLLGYGATSHPTDAREYTMVGIANDVKDLLDAENVQKVIAVGHDWGAILLSRFVNLHPDRLHAVAFLAVGYTPPTPTFNFEVALATMNKFFGYDVFGYWEYLASDDSPKQIEDNIDSFYSLVFPKDPMLWRTVVAIRGKMREWIETKNQGPLPGYWDAKGQKEHQGALLRGGLTGPLNYYACAVKGFSNEPDSQIPESQYKFAMPCFFGAALKDYVCLHGATKLRMPQFASNMVTEDFDTSHWIMAEASEHLNAALDKFISNSGLEL